MSKRIEILDGETVINTISASPEFAEQNHPGSWRLAEYQDPEPEPTDYILSAIDALERKFLMPRVAREVFIAQAEERGLALGYTLAQLRAKNKGYAGLKALDEQIAALRAQL